MKYTTEQERVAAREAFVAQAVTIYPAATEWEHRANFDRAFPPLAPVRMKPMRGYATIDTNGTVLDQWLEGWNGDMNGCREEAEESAQAHPGSRVAEVEVREVGDEVPLKQERYWCGCVREARWVPRCAKHAQYDHDEEPPMREAS